MSAGFAYIYNCDFTKKNLENVDSQGFKWSMVRSCRTPLPQQNQKVRLRILPVTQPRPCHRASTRTRVFRHRQYKSYRRNNQVCISFDQL